MGIVNPAAIARNSAFPLLFVNLNFPSSICFRQQLLNRHRLFGRNATSKGWREAVRTLLADKIEVPDKQRNGVFQVVQLL